RLGNLANTQRPRTFAEVAKDPKGQGTLLGKPTKPSKPSYIPERLSNPRNTPQPIRTYFEGQDPLGQTLETLLARISTTQPAKAIRGLRKVPKLPLPVSPTTLEAGPYLRNTEKEWPPQMG